MERFIFWAISRDFIPEVTSLRSISSSVSVQGRPAGRGPVISLFLASGAAFDERAAASVSQWQIQLRVQ
jgi:hypothetical protein